MFVAAMVTTLGRTTGFFSRPHLRSKRFFQLSPIRGGSISISSWLRAPPPPPIIPPIMPPTPIPARAEPMESISSMNRMQAPCFWARPRALRYRRHTVITSIPRNMALKEAAEV